MLLATVAIACLGNYIFRAVIVVRFFIIYPLSPKPPSVMSLAWLPELILLPASSLSLKLVLSSVIALA